MESIWENDARQVRLDALMENKSTDVLIVGGGFRPLAHCPAPTTCRKCF